MRYDYRPPNHKHILNIGNKVINDRKIPIFDEFKTTVQKYFSADIQTADFRHNSAEETRKVNDWVKNKTNNKIQKIYDRIPDDTSLLILNVIYFKGKAYCH